MIAQVGTMLFVTPDAGCEVCDGTGAMWIDREVNAAEECSCITRQLDEHEPAFSHYEVIAENANENSRKLYAALKQLENYEEALQRERNRVEALRYAKPEYIFSFDSVKKMAGYTN